MSHIGKSSIILIPNDSAGNRTRVTAVKGRCLNRLTTEPYSDFFPVFLPVLKQLRCFLAPRVGLEPTTTRLTAECSTIELSRKKVRLRRTLEKPPVFPSTKSTLLKVIPSKPNTKHLYPTSYSSYFTHAVISSTSCFRFHPPLHFYTLEECSSGDILLKLEALLPILWLSFRSISICQLNTLLCLHPRPIYLVVFKGPSSFDPDISS